MEIVTLDVGVLLPNIAEPDTSTLAPADAATTAVSNVTPPSTMTYLNVSFGVQIRVKL